MPNKSIVIIGGGLAGMSAAYELTKAGQKNVTLIEAAERLGGRTQDVDVLGQRIELGGFMIFPWYREFRRLVGEMGMSGEIRRLGTYNQYFQLPDGSYRLSSHTPLKDLIDPRLALHCLIPYLRGRLNFYEPDLSIYEDLTMRELMERVTRPGSDAIHNLNQISTVYGYGSLDELSPALILGFLPKLLFGRGFDDVQYLEGGVSSLVQAVYERIVNAGGKVLLNTRVTDVAQDSVQTDTGDVPADVVIYANGIGGSLLEEAIPTLDLPVSGRYTRNYVLIFTTENRPVIDGSTDWAIVYNSGPTDDNLHMSLLANGSTPLHSDVNAVAAMVSVGARSEQTPTPGEVEAFASRCAADILDGDNGLTLHTFKAWEETMPLVDGKFVQALKDAQGVNGRFYAGDHLGLPSMETAVYSGARAARLVLES